MGFGSSAGRVGWPGDVDGLLIMDTARDRLFSLHENLTQKALEIMRAKNHDYTTGSGDPYSNFRNSSVVGVAPELGLLIRVIDKIMRLRTFISSGTLEVKNESVEDAIIDIINYMVLLAGLIEENKRG